MSLPPTPIAFTAGAVAIESWGTSPGPAAFLWCYVPDSAQRPKPQTASISLSKELKKLDWNFVGPTTVDAFMQAMGLVNDHPHGCMIRKKVEHARKNFVRRVADKRLICDKRRLRFASD